ncbi:VanZ family protein [Alkaliphilus hydrothermalis]|nr:VanZ family protein [Alkaliphilus hydrothermalis]
MIYIFVRIIIYIFASLDEYRQSFVDGRFGSLINVAIDMIGI